MFPHCGSFSIGPRRPLSYAKLGGTNPAISLRGSTSSLLIEKFPRRMPISGLVPLSLAYDMVVVYAVQY